MDNNLANLLLIMAMITISFIMYGLGNLKGYDKGWKAGAESQIELNDAISEDSVQ